MKKWYTVILIAVILATISALCFLNYESLKVRYLFFKIKLYQENIDRAEPYMERLSNSKKGIDICVDDISLCYSETNGLSSMVVRNATDSQYAILKLHELINNENTPNDVLIEANLLIWELTNDDKSLINIFEILSRESRESKKQEKNILLVFCRGALYGEVMEDKQEEFLEKYQNGTLWQLSKEEFINYFKEG